MRDEVSVSSRQKVWQLQRRFDELISPTEWAEYLLEQRRSFYFQITILGSQIWSRPFVTFWQTAEELLITSKFKWTPSGCQFDSDWKSFLSPEPRSASHQRLRVHWAIGWPDRLCVSQIWWTTDDICEAGRFVKVCGAAHFRDLFLNTGFMLETRLNHAAPSNVRKSSSTPSHSWTSEGESRHPGEVSAVLFWHCQQLVATGEGKNADRSINWRLCFLAQQKKLTVLGSRQSCNLVFGPNCPRRKD